VACLDKEKVTSNMHSNSHTYPATARWPRGHAHHRNNGDNGHHRHSGGRLEYGWHNLPQSILDAQARMKELLLDVAEINLKLDDAQNRARAGRTYTNGANGHEAWKVRANTAKLYKEREIAFLKTWLEQESNKIQNLGKLGKVDPKDPRTIMIAVLKMFRSLEEDDTETYPEEDELKHIIERHLGLAA
jgi:hypothetical protein